MKRRIIFITIFIMVVGSVLTSLHFSRVETVYSLALKNIEALLQVAKVVGQERKQLVIRIMYWDRMISMIVKDKRMIFQRNVKKLLWPEDTMIIRRLV